MPEFLNAQTIGTIVIAAIVILLSITIFLKPIRLLFRLLINTIGGFLILFLLNNALGQFIGVSLGFNWFNAVVVGIFGLPGVGLLLILQWLLVI